jgi:prepilin-type processing-associated H-X9-DG protein
LTLAAKHRVFDCPATESRVCFCGSGLNGGFTTYEKIFDYVTANTFSSYGFGNYKKLDELPAKAVLLMEMRASLAINTTATGPCPFLIPFAYYEISTSRVPFHHSNGANFGFPDGRVEWHKRSDY